MPDTRFVGEHRESAAELNSHNSPVCPVPDGGHDSLGTSAHCKLLLNVARALRTTGYPALRSLDIEICGGVVILWGRVPSYYQKQLAQETVQRVEGVEGIANGIEVVCCR